MSVGDTSNANNHGPTRGRPLQGMNSLVPVDPGPHDNIVFHKNKQMKTLHSRDFCQLTAHTIKGNELFVFVPPDFLYLCSANQSS